MKWNQNFVQIANLGMRKNTQKDEARKWFLKPENRETNDCFQLTEFRNFHEKIVFFGLFVVNAVKNKL